MPDPSPLEFLADKYNNVCMDMLEQIKINEDLIKRITNEKEKRSGASFLDQHKTNQSLEPRMADTIETTLAERGKRYGVFADHARITQNIKAAMAGSKNWEALPDDMRESLEMIAHKIGRILNGDPRYHDSWHDLGGYAKLVADALLPKVESSRL